LYFNDLSVSFIISALLNKVIIDEIDKWFDRKDRRQKINISSIRVEYTSLEYQKAVFILGQILDGPMALQQQNKWAG
jgi:hypothetical protein